MPAVPTCGGNSPRTAALHRSRGVKVTIQRGVGGKVPRMRRTRAAASRSFPSDTAAAPRPHTW
jgi:hypothetical protein